MSHSRFRAGEAVLKELGVPESEERRAVEETAAFLAGHQPVIDIPPVIDLDDVVARWGGR
ncbi:hypothetical protein [Streptomyces orinoci]|uniref:Uncharacterized protein n=1 Tax=Streptomyces orinoci TaxID=67339 RepID=A0ABV3JZ10_STRON|nr:hypothetical protein [Streptomyces orinoci]